MLNSRNAIGALVAVAVVVAGCGSPAAGPSSVESSSRQGESLAPPAPSPSAPTPSSSSTPPTAQGPDGVRPAGPTALSLVIKTVTVDDLAAASVVQFDTVRVVGSTAANAATAQRAVDEVASFDLQWWRDVDPDVCELGGPPCGEWTQSVQERRCREPYLCVLVQGSGVFPGTASSSSITSSLTLDSLTGEAVTLEEAIAPVQVSTVLGFVTEKVASRQIGAWGISCADPAHVAFDPLEVDDLDAWLPTAKGLRVWLSTYRVGPGSLGVVPVLITWRELADADLYVDLGLTGCEAIAVDADGLPVTMVDGERTASGYLCGREIAELPDIVPGAQNILYTRVLQVILRSYGLYAGPYDGIYDVGTQDAVRRYQSSSGLGVDAQVGPKTWGSLQASFCRNWG